MKRKLALSIVAVLSVILFLLFLVMPVILTEAMFIGADLFDRLLRWATIKTGNTTAGSFILSLSLLIGVIAFILREKVRFVYAIIELFFGIYGTAIALTALYNSHLLPLAVKSLVDVNNPYQLYVGLGSGVYIIVRGMENLVKGFMEMSAWTDKFVAKLRGKQISTGTHEETV